MHILDFWHSKITSQVVSCGVAYKLSQRAMRKHLNILVVSGFMLCSLTGLAQSQGWPTPVRDPKLPVLRATAPVEIIGTVVAHDADGGMGIGLVDVYAYLDVLIIRVGKVLDGKPSGKYVRADFLGGADESLPKSLFDGKPWKIRLWAVPPNPYWTCAWTIRPNPPQNSLEMSWWPRIVPVAGVKNFPDPNDMYCYVIKSDSAR